MQIAKEKIIEILCKESLFFEVSGDTVEALDAGDFDNVAEQILNLLQSNDAVQPNASKPNVSGSLPLTDADKLAIAWKTLEWVGFRRGDEFTDDDILKMLGGNDR